MSKSFLDNLQEVLKGNQHKIDANKNGKVDAQDFKLLKAKKEEAPQTEAKVPNIAAGPGSLTVFGSKSAFEEVDFFAEAKRGRPRKDGAKFAGEDDTQEADKNIMNQLRKKPEGEHQNLTFNNGEKKKVHVIHATRALSMLQNSKPSERLDIQNSLAHSHDRFMQTVKTGKAIKDEPRAKVSLAKRVSEEVELEEAVSVNKRNYSWGKMITVNHGSSHSFPLHPEHQEKIAKLKDGESVAFTDETKAKVKAHREGDTVHLSHEGSNTKTPVSYSHFSEEYIDEAGAFTGGQVVSPQARAAAGAFGRGVWDSATWGGGKYLMGTADYLAKKALGRPTNWSQEVDQEAEKTAKAQKEHPTAYAVGEHGTDLAMAATGGPAIAKFAVKQVGKQLVKAGAKDIGAAAVRYGDKPMNVISRTIGKVTDPVTVPGTIAGGAGYTAGLIGDPKRAAKDLNRNVNPFATEEVLKEDATTMASDRRAKKAVTFRDPKTGRVKVKWQTMPKREIDIGESVLNEGKIVPKPKIKTGEIGFMKGGGPEQHAAIAESFLIELTNEQIEKISEVFEKLNEKNKEAFINNASSSIEGSQAMLDFAINIE